MKIWAAFGVMQCHAIFLDRRVREHSAARNRFDCPPDAQVAGMRLRLASNFLMILAPSPCVFFENWTRSQVMWQSQLLPLPPWAF